MASYGIGRAKGIATNAADFVTEDLPKAAGGLWDAVSHPIDTVSNMHPIDALERNGLALQDWSREYFKAARSGNWQKAGEMQGEFEGKSIAATTLTVGAGTAVSAALKAQFGERLFLSESFGINSNLFGNSIAGNRGSLNQPGGIFKMGWSNTAKDGGGMVFRIGILSKDGAPNQAVFHLDVAKTFVANAFSNPAIAVKRSLQNLESQAR